MTAAAIRVSGVGVHPFGRFQDESLKDLARIAVARALEDTGILGKQVDAVYSANAMAGVLQGQEMIRGQSVLRDLGIDRVPIVNVENACASGSTAFRQAVLTLRAGAARRVLVVGFEKMFVGDLDRSLDALESAADLDVVAGLGIQFTAIYAMRIRKRIEAGAITYDDLVDVTVKNARNGSLNPNAQHQRELTREEVRGARMIAEPLTLYMCSSICDGAAAAVLELQDGDHADESGPAITVRASAAASGFPRIEDAEPTVTEICAEAAYSEAGLGPGDVDIAEVHDAMAPGELLYYEQLGLCEPGDAGRLLASGDTAIDGRLPVNASGGLSARGHAVGATGLAQIAELVWQLRGTAGARQVTNQPRIALAHNSGGWLEGESAACCVHILERKAAWT